MDAAEALGEVEPQVVETAVETETGATDEVKAEPTETIVEKAETESEDTAKAAVESPSTETKEPAMVNIAAMHGERDRRQDLQKEFDAYKTAHPEKEPEPPPSVFDDENVAFDHRDQRLSNVLMDTLLNEGKSEAISQYDAETVEAAEKWFIDEAQKSPMLANQLQGTTYMQQHRKVVEIYKAEMSRADASQNPAEHDARMKAQGVEEFLAKQKETQDGKQAVIDSIPTSMVGEPSAGTIKSTDWSGPTPLDSIISSR